MDQFYWSNKRGTGFLKDSGFVAHGLKRPFVIVPDEKKNRVLIVDMRTGYTVANARTVKAAQAKLIDVEVLMEEKQKKAQGGEWDLRPYETDLRRSLEANLGKEAAQAYMNGTPLQDGAPETIMIP